MPVSARKRATNSSVAPGAACEVAVEGGDDGAVLGRQSREVGVVDEVAGRRPRGHRVGEPRREASARFWVDDVRGYAPAVDDAERLDDGERPREHRWVRGDAALTA